MASSLNAGAFSFMLENVYTQIGCLLCYERFLYIPEHKSEPDYEAITEILG